MTEAFVRYRHDGRACYGLLEGDTIHELQGSPFETVARARRAVALREVRLLPPCEPTKIIAIGRNYRSHLGIGRRPARRACSPSSRAVWSAPETTLSSPLARRTSTTKAKWSW